MENNNNDQLVEAPSIPVEASVNDISEEQIANIVASLRSAQPTNFKARFQGIAGTAKPKANRFWFNGNLISKEEHDKLGLEEIHASNNIVRK